jgi:single-stranded-DNA-specific exonuclease
MKRFRWNVLQPDEQLVRGLSETINVSSAIARALCNRGIATFEDARFFFRPSLEFVPSPFLMMDMKRAVSRVVEAIRSGETIMIYGDYDVDGTTGTAMLSLFLREQGAETCYYINDRFREGYGISDAGIAAARESNASLIITVDCGIRAVDAIRSCSEKGIDVIVCDHHEADELPPAYAILNPKVESCNYPFRELCGCGVALKLMQAVTEDLGAGKECWQNHLDLVAIATAADMVALVQENRIYLREGLNRIHTRPRENIREMTAVMGISPEEVSMTHIAYGIAPRINAAGRMDSAHVAMQWLLSSEASDVYSSTGRLDQLNSLRRETDAGIMAKAEAMVEGHFASYCSSIVLYHEEWHLGVLGIVASKLLDKYALPTIIMGRMNGLIKGSVRSVEQINIFEVLRECSDHLEQFGGHCQAAGITLKPENLSAFRKRFDEVCSGLLPVEKRQKELLIDSELPLHSITRKFMHVLEQFSPFGYGNREPLFVSPACRLSGAPKLLKSRHVKFAVPDGKGGIVEAIAFDRPDIYHDLAAAGGNAEFVLAYVPERKQWNSREYLQLRIRDLEIL